jgi:translation initiation factor 1A
MAGLKRKFAKRDKFKKKTFAKGSTAPPQIIRVKLPRGVETLGVLEQRLGASQMRVRCLDGKTRLCRIPGALKKRLWVREGDILLIKPWEFSGETKGDVIYKYRPNQVDWLRKNGHLEGLEEFEEF